MTTVKKADPFRTLLKWTIALLVLFALLLTGYFMMDAWQKGERAQQEERIRAENERIIQEYNLAVAQQQAALQTGEVKTWPEPLGQGFEVLDVSDFPLAQSREVIVSRKDLLAGGLMLVNRWHGMPEDFTIMEQEMKSIGMTTSYRVPVENAAVSLQPVAIEALDRMVAAAKEEGLEDFIVRTGYRDAATQLANWDKELALHTARYSGDGLIEKTRERVAFPGTSDYHTGLSVNLDVYNRNDSALNNTKFHESYQGEWTYQHSWEYGFVFRFPVAGFPASDSVDKSYITGIDLQMNTYRYVGLAHAEIMHKLGFTLEEYIDYLIKTPHIAIYEDGVLKYEVYRIQAALGDASIRVPERAKSYQASTDNMGGIIVLASY